MTLSFDILINFILLKKCVSVKSLLCDKFLTARESLFGIVNIDSVNVVDDGYLSL